jgi:signal transduction histidine kinase
MQTEIAQSGKVTVRAGAVATILHDLCQPLTALECSLELALLPRSPAEVRTLTTAALAAARRLHALANQAQAIEGLCRKYRSPKVVSGIQIAARFSLAIRAEDAEKNLYLDVEGLAAIVHRISQGSVRRGSVTCSGSLLRIALMLPITHTNTADACEPAISSATLSSALVEHLGGRLTLSENVAVLEFPTH